MADNSVKFGQQLVVMTEATVVVHGQSVFMEMNIMDKKL